MSTAPHVYVIPAIAAPVAAVFLRRGPWVQLAKWSLTTGRLVRGAWFRGRIYQRRCDVSPDGELLSYFAMKGGKPFHAVSRVPWLTALAFWRDDSTWTTGHHFAPIAQALPSTVTLDGGSLVELGTRHRLCLVPNSGAPYEAERRRGWTEHPDAPPRAKKGDVWDERRPQRLMLRQPSGSRVLELRDEGYARGRFEGRAPRYFVDDAPLVDATWADWAASGELLVALRTGRLEIRAYKKGAVRVRAAHDIADFTPDPQPAPPAALRW